MQLVNAGIVKCGIERWCGYKTAPPCTTLANNANKLLQVISSVVKSYIEGLVWVMRYYYDGVASWNWWVLGSGALYVFYKGEQRAWRECQAVVGHALLKGRGGLMELVS